jgi:poly(A) polymerase
VFRRDFTINTLVENLHKPGILDLTGLGMSDLRAGIIRTPLEPGATFRDDPLRMLRAVRFAVSLGFRIEPLTWSGIREQSGRIDLVGEGPRVVSAERIRDEFIKIVMSREPARGLELLRDGGLLNRFLPELCAMAGVTQNEWHAHDVWTHTLRALSALPDTATLSVRLATLFHDVGKPPTRSEDERGVHFYDHQQVGAEMTRAALLRLRMPSEVVSGVSDLVRLHMRLGEVRPEWSKAAVRRLVREVGDRLDDLHTVARADMAAMGGTGTPTDIDAVMVRIEETNAEMNAAKVESPLTGRQIMDILQIAPGPLVGEAKEHLINEVLEGRMLPDDAEQAARALAEWAQLRKAAS